MTGQKLGEYLRNRGIRLRWVAKQIGITPQAFYYKIRGISKITVDDAVTIRNSCRMTDTEFADVFGSENWYAVL